ncbi:MAG: hypothetical protein H7A36_03910 [Chlamydiales bacterium]|nr:hypothetical protein [Chlamydiales bacterium]
MAFSDSMRPVEGPAGVHNPQEVVRQGRMGGHTVREGGLGSETERKTSGVIVSIKTFFANVWAWLKAKLGIGRDVVVARRETLDDAVSVTDSFGRRSLRSNSESGYDTDSLRTRTPSPVFSEHEQRCLHITERLDAIEGRLKAHKEVSGSEIQSLYQEIYKTSEHGLTTIHVDGRTLVADHRMFKERLDKASAIQVDRDHFTRNLRAIEASAEHIIDRSGLARIREDVQGIITDGPVQEAALKDVLQRATERIEKIEKDGAVARLRRTLEEASSELYTLAGTRQGNIQELYGKAKRVGEQAKREAKELEAQERGRFAERQAAADVVQSWQVRVNEESSQIYELKSDLKRRERELLSEACLELGAVHKGLDKTRARILQELEGTVILEDVAAARLASLKDEMGMAIAARDTASQALELHLKGAPAALGKAAKKETEIEVTRKKKKKISVESAKTTLTAAEDKEVADFNGERDRIKSVIDSYEAQIEQKMEAMLLLLDPSSLMAQPRKTARTRKSIRHKVDVDVQKREQLVEEYAQARLLGVDNYELEWSGLLIEVRALGQERYGYIKELQPLRDELERKEAALVSLNQEKAASEEHLAAKETQYTEAREKAGKAGAHADRYERLDSVRRGVFEGNLALRELRTACRSKPAEYARLVREVAGDVPADLYEL